jgi:hypothetical protein
MDIVLQNIMSLIEEESISEINYILFNQLNSLRQRRVAIQSASFQFSLRRP